MALTISRLHERMTHCTVVSIIPKVEAYTFIVMTSLIQQQSTTSTSSGFSLELQQLIIAADRGETVHVPPASQATSFKRYFVAAERTNCQRSLLKSTQARSGVYPERSFLWNQAP